VVAAPLILVLSFIDSIHYEGTSHLMNWERSGGYNLAVFHAAPFLWLAVIPSSGFAAKDRFARAWLAVAAVR
jgi:hypothetical protein